MTPAVAIVPAADHDRLEKPAPADRDPGIVTRSGLLAENMPSFLERLGKVGAVTLARLPF